MTTKRKILITSALPYANGPLHLGHMVGYIQADIWVRFQKMLGHDCLYVCGSDSHGTPIMIQAEKMGITPETLIQQVQLEQERDFNDFMIGFDNYYTTHSDENREFVETIFKRHLAKGNISKRTIKQLYDPEKKIFLPDRYIKGECPHCSAKDQYANKLDEWFTTGLQEWDISRDAPYFGFVIPEEKNKYFYVWLDAPIGYMASFKNLCARKKINFDDYWNPNSTAELYHFIGKDIIYFHALFWPAILHGASYRTPTAIYANGFVTIEGQKMSKSRGTFIRARTYLEYLHPEYLRYYFAAKISNRIEDLEINFY